MGTCRELTNIAPLHTSSQHSILEKAAEYFILYYGCSFKTLSRAFVLGVQHLVHPRLSLKTVLFYNHYWIAGVGLEHGSTYDIALFTGIVQDGWGPKECEAKSDSITSIPTLQSKPSNATRWAYTRVRTCPVPAPNLAPRS